MNKVTVIAEIGINHEGNMDKAKMLIEIAKSVNADIAKFQWYRPLEVLGKDSPYLEEATACQFTEDQHKEIKAYCDTQGIEWCLSIFHEDQVPFCESLGMLRYKIASRAALDDGLLDTVRRTGKPVYISTGLCDGLRLKQIRGMFGADYPLTMLYCVCDYPTRLDRINLDKMVALRTYSSEVGFSSHCPQIAPTLAAVARGARVTENHIVIGREHPGCDVSSSLNMQEFNQMIKLIRDMEGMC